MKNTKLIITLSIVSAVLVLIITATVAFYFGAQRQASMVEALENQLVIEKSRAIDNQKLTQTELNKTLNDYDSACFAYQELYAAYDTLYKKTGASSGLEKLALRDGARGNEESCYR